jgi:hypothetical protein
MSVSLILDESEVVPRNLIITTAPVSIGVVFLNCCAAYLCIINTQNGKIRHNKHTVSHCEKRAVVVNFNFLLGLIN